MRCLLGEKSENNEMQVSVENVGTLGRRLTVAVPAEQFEQAFATRLERLSRQVKLPGFRPGKVPIKMVEARFGGKLLEEVAGELIETTLREAIGAQGLKPAGGTRIRHKPLARGHEFEYTAEFEIFPEITRLDLAGVPIERPSVTIAEEDIDRTLENLRRQRVVWQPVERVAQKDDRLMADFVGRMNGAEVEGTRGTNSPVVIGSGALLQDLEQGLIGAKAGETRTVAVLFPANYGHAALAGQKVEFEVKVHEVAEPVLPVVDEEFAKALGVQEGGVDKLRSEIKANLEREAAGRVRAVTRRNVMRALLGTNQFEVPSSLVAAEMDRIRRIAEAMRGSGGAPVPEGADDEMLRRRASTRVALGLILAEVVRARGIKADPAKVRWRIEEMAQDYDAPEKFVEWYYSSPERLGEIESTVMEERVVEELSGSAQIQEKAVGFQELLTMDVTIE